VVSGLPQKAALLGVISVSDHARGIKIEIDKINNKNKEGLGKEEMEVEIVEVVGDVSAGVYVKGIPQSSVLPTKIIIFQHI